MCITWPLWTQKFSVHVSISLFRSHRCFPQAFSYFPMAAVVDPNPLSPVGIQVTTIFGAGIFTGIFFYALQITQVVFVQLWLRHKDAVIK